MKKRCKVLFIIVCVLGLVAHAVGVAPVQAGVGDDHHLRCDRHSWFWR